MAKADRGAGATLTVDLDAIAANYRLLAGKVGGVARCAASVKADAYGLGIGPVARALDRAGCARFFVATVDEGIRLRRLLPNSVIYVLHGVLAGGVGDCVEHDLRPVINSLGDLEICNAAVGRRGSIVAALHIDTGMARLGLTAEEVAALAAEPQRLARLGAVLLMSHLACADEPDHLMNRQQRMRFDAACARLQHALAFRPRLVERSLVGSSGIFLGPDFHYDLARPGAAIYGLAPFPNTANPMRQVIRLQGKILQVRRVDRGGTVGYGATHRFARPARVATVGAGYADGYLRSLGNHGSAYVGESRVPVVGRVSMDLITLEVSALPEEATRPGTPVDLIGPHNPVDALAAEAGTIGYEILTALGKRYARRYVRGAEWAA